MKLLLITLLLALPAHAEVPPHGEFRREELYGMYQFEACENAGSSIWEGDHSRQYIVISHDPFDTRAMPPDYLAATLFHTPPSPIVPIWEFSDLNQGWVKTYDEKTGLVRTAHENYVTNTGVYSRMEWNFGEDSGWATLHLTKADATHLTYEMARHDELSGNSRSESCRLVRVAE